jgi:hypothetical protein
MVCTELFELRCTEGGNAMTDEQGRLWKEADVAFFMVLFMHSHREGLSATTTNLRTAGQKFT